MDTRLRSMAMVVGLVALAFAEVGEAQRGRGGPPPRPIAGHGVEVPGWQARLDDPADLGQAMSFEPMGEGLHAMTGPTAIFWDPLQYASGEYAVSATLTLAKPASHQVAYGLFIGGMDLTGDDQQYTYFVIRQNGQFLIKRRNGSTTSNVAGDWAPHAAVMQPDASGRMVNEMTIRVGSATVSFLLNGMEVASHPASAIDTEGLVGLRIGHGLDLEIQEFAVE